eukprot:CAMPEP_0184674688 /NCGR_PEP_ID=MMETSP0308-20130426/87377_1 /TAXON_ID=38269 /ORGANISM="Gloeochaete witrockiana, Strain SAG 46.84" /LENGTH=147 /DNA_ID=CAMNT_0027122321 /DNA_START=1499 /DNA_END=1942 /DNA_ORIENTATION=-
MDLVTAAMADALTGNLMTSSLVAGGRLRSFIEWGDGGGGGGGDDCHLMTSHLWSDWPSYWTWTSRQPEKDGAAFRTRRLVYMESTPENSDGDTSETGDGGASDAMDDESDSSRDERSEMGPPRRAKSANSDKIGQICEGPFALSDVV